MLKVNRYSLAYNLNLPRRESSFTTFHSTQLSLTTDLFSRTKLSAGDARLNPVKLQEIP